MHTPPLDLGLALKERGGCESGGWGESVCAPPLSRRARAFLSARSGLGLSRSERTHRHPIVTVTHPQHSVTSESFVGCTRLSAPYTPTLPSPPPHTPPLYHSISPPLLLPSPPLTHSLNHFHHTTVCHRTLLIGCPLSLSSKPRCCCYPGGRRKYRSWSKTAIM